MRIFQNKASQHIIIVTDKLAYSFYGYTDEDPLLAVKHFLNTKDGFKTVAVGCEEIENPADLQKDQKPLETPIVNDNDFHNHVLIPEEE